MSAPSIPTNYHHKLHPDADFNHNVDVEGLLESKLSGGIDATHGGSIETRVAGKLETDNDVRLTGDRNQPIATLLIGDRNQPVATDSKIEILNLPRFTLQDIKDMMKVRVHIPHYSNVCFKVLGVELFSLCMNGESQVITEPYVANASEQCDPDCCEPDTRPFPETSTTGGNG